MAQVLRFCPLQSCVDVTFWSELSDRKLDQYKLSEKPIDIAGFLTASRHEEVGSTLQVLAASFAGQAATTMAPRQQGTHVAPGELLLTNTMESLKGLDKAALLQQAGRVLWHDIVSGAAEACPQLLLRFLLLAHGDLKAFVFTYWFAFPALKPPEPFTQMSGWPLTEAYPHLQRQICAAADAWRAAGDCSSSGAAAAYASGGRGKGAAAPFFLMRLIAAAVTAFGSEGAVDTVQIGGLDSWEELNAAASPATTCTASKQQQQQEQQQEQRQQQETAAAAASEVLLVMFDPCHLQLTPGWPLRNALLLAAVRWGVTRLKVLCVRDSSAGRASPERCFVLEVGLPTIPAGWHQQEAAAAMAAGVPDVLGWEANAQGKLLPRSVDVSPLLSPVQLAEQAVDLNLRLMRWRAAPGLDIGALSATRCLLLGAGTLGCAVARCLLAWGVRHITFVDAARVSYSNPVRQSLFQFADCLGGGKPKAQAAAAALVDIFPSVQAAGHDISIPMPGHAPANAKAEQAAQQAAEQLQQLVSSHDVIFLLTDTRESRWLPTLLAAAAGKVAITAALGFDTFLVMRHGVPAQQPSSGTPAATAASSSASAARDSQQQQQEQEQGYRRLGCYFCNDVVAPLNSTNDRALDQQCTVARPGLAAIAGSLAVELMAALLQHPLKGQAPAPPVAAPSVGSNGGSSAAAAGLAGSLGPVPHMVRGQLSGFGQCCMVGEAFGQCTACCPAVVQRYRDLGWSFVRQALHQPGMLEELTGLAELHRQAAELDLDSASEAGSLDGDEAEGPFGGNTATSAPVGVKEAKLDEGWTEL